MYSTMVYSRGLITVSPCRFQKVSPLIRCITGTKWNSQSGPKNTKRKHVVLKTVSGIFGVIAVSCIARNEVIKSKNRRMGIEPVSTNIQPQPLFGLFRYKGCTISYDVLKTVHTGRIEDFDVREDDVWIATFPRSGTTLTSEMAYLIVNDLNFNKAKEEFLSKRVPYFENSFTTNLKDIDQMPSPRTIKTHLPLQLLPKQLQEQKAKIIYVARNPKDVSISIYHFIKIFPAIFVKFHRPTQEEVYELILSGYSLYGPWWSHVREFWDIRNRENILFLKYEDIVKDPETTVKQISSFPGKQITDEGVQQIAEHCKFDRMKNNPKVNLQEYIGINNDLKFIRKGETGGWKNEMTMEISTKFNEMMKTELGESGLSFCDSDS